MQEGPSDTSEPLLVYNTPTKTTTSADQLSVAIRQITFVTDEGDSFEVCQSVAEMFGFIKARLMEDLDDDEGLEIIVPNVKSSILSKVIMFAEHYDVEAMTEIEKPIKSTSLRELVQEWYASFIDVEQTVLFDLIQAANHMDNQPLLALACAVIHSMIKGRTPEEIRGMFNIVLDFSPHEEAIICEENKWCEEA